MEGTTLTRPRPGPTPARPRPSVWDRGDRLAKVAFALLCLGFVVGFFVFPTYPVYDSYYSLLWGRDLLHGDPLVFDGLPLPDRASAGDRRRRRSCSSSAAWGDRLWVAMTLASFLVLIAGVYRLGRMAATPLVGAVAAALLMTRFDYPFLAARGYIDIPYMALVVWAATLEATRRAAASRCCSCSRSRGCCGPRRGSWPRCTGCGWRGRRPGASGSSTPRWPRSVR